jgi:purine-binding chemotaxis protein CheW
MKIWAVANQKSGRGQDHHSGKLGWHSGLIADGLSHVLMLEPDEVRWRSERSRRPWLAGTAIEAMCAILDIDNLCAPMAIRLTLMSNDEISN